MSYLEAAKIGAARTTTPTGLQDTLETLTKVVADLLTVTRLGQRNEIDVSSGVQTKRHGEKQRQC